MLWTEKYRPKTIKEIVGQEHFVEDALGWIASKEMPNLLLYGNAGIGKTAAAGALSLDMLTDNFEGNFFEINASDDRRLETVRTTIKDIASTMKLGDVPFKIIMLDEMDGMTPDAQNALRRIMERYSENVRFIITCNYRHKIIYPLQSRCANYLFKSLSSDVMYDVINNILVKEGNGKYASEDLRTFIGGFNGDMRRAITELQAATASNTALSIQIERMQEPYDKLLDSILNKQYESALTQTHIMLSLSLDIKSICISLHDVILIRELDSNTKFKLLRIIGESEWRSSNMTPKVLVSWMIGQMV